MFFSPYRSRMVGPVSLGESGAVAVLVALILPVAILFLSFVVDLGNAFYHHRHLQVEADAAALAGASQFNSSCSDANIVGRALEYAGVPQSLVRSNTNWTGGVTTYSDPGAPFNSQIGGTPSANIYGAINSANYLPTGNTAPLDTTTFSGSPCADSMLDVKMTETNLPWYFQAGGLNYINVHARASWVVAGSGDLPLAVDENAPQKVTAYFVNESAYTNANGQSVPAGTILAQTNLIDTHSTVSSGPYAGDDTWSSAVNPITLPVPTKDVGVILALSGNPTDTTCGDQLVSCYNQNSGTGGDDLLDIQGYSTSGAGSLSTPIVRQVALAGSSDGSGCSSASGLDGYYSVSAATTGTCDVDVHATIDLGSNPNPTGAMVQASIGNKQYPLSFDSTNQWWTGTVPVALGSGPNPIDLWVCNGNPCNKNTAVILRHVQATFAANDVSGTSSTNSGTIDELVVSKEDSQGNLAPANSLPMCTTSCPTVVVTADIGGSLHDATSVNDPVFALNFSNNNTSSQTGAIECPPGTSSAFNLGATLLAGCPGTYNVNYSSQTNTFSDPNCTNTNPIQGNTPPPPADCVQAKNGVAQGQIGQNLYCRFVGDYYGGTGCVTASDPSGSAVGTWYCDNKWSGFDPTGNYDGLPAGDSRIVKLFVVPYDSFVGSGANGRIVPILDIAYFYVIGWNVPGQSADPCANDFIGANAPPSGGNGNNGARIWGHFMALTTFGGSGTQPCKDSGLGACTVILTQ
jgi:Flp pilus assembly protein TadG